MAPIFRQFYPFIKIESRQINMTIKGTPFIHNKCFYPSNLNLYNSSILILLKFYFFRSLGVHITFVRSIAMDGWTEEQLKIMKMSGNDKCASYLASKGVIASTPLREKYSISATQLYKLILKAQGESV